jgi:hypothetical protein
LTLLFTIQCADGLFGLTESGASEEIKPHQSNSSWTFSDGHEKLLVNSDHPEWFILRMGDLTFPSSHPRTDMALFLRAKMKDLIPKSADSADFALRIKNELEMEWHKEATKSGTEIVLWIGNVSDGGEQSVFEIRGNPVFGAPHIPLGLPKKIKSNPPFHQSFAYPDNFLINCLLGDRITYKVRLYASKSKVAMSETTEKALQNYAKIRATISRKRLTLADAEVLGFALVQFLIEYSKDEQHEETATGYRSAGGIPLIAQLLK